MRQILFAAIAAGVGLVAHSEALPAGWTDDFQSARDAAERSGVPLVVVFGNTSCPHCNDLCAGIAADESLAAWVSTHPCQFVVKHDPFQKDQEDWAPDYKAAYDWIKSLKTGKPSLYPFVGIWWKRPDGTEVSLKFTGRTGSMPEKTPRGDLIGQLVATFEKELGEFGDVMARFRVGGTPCDRLEALPGTAFVDVPVRRNSVVGSPCATTFVARSPGGAVLAQADFTWGADEAERTLRVNIPAGTWRAGGEISLTLTNRVGGATVAFESAIRFVEAGENNPKDPLWLGERALDTLQAGEWTMDYGLAKARAAERRKPLLALVGGSLWCPDCVKIDHYLVDTPAFRQWLRDNDVSCAAIDVPCTPMGKTTCLLTYDATTVSARYENATVPPQEAVQSGAGYLSRHGIPQTGNGGVNAQAVLARNNALLTNDTAHAGLCRPENLSDDNAETGVFKTGIPCLIVMRPDGTVAGRLYQFNNVSPGDTADLGAYLKRMDELVALCADAQEEDDASWLTTRREAALEGVAAGTVSAVDQVDVYALPARAGWARGSISVKSDDVCADAAMASENNVSLSLLSVSAAGAVTVKGTVRGNLFAGVTLDGLVLEDKAERLFVEVRALGTVDNNVEGAYVSKTFALERPDASTVAYSLTTAIGYPVSTIGFERAALSLNEKSAGRQTLKVVRGNGASGAVRATVAVDAATTALPDTYALEDATVAWADGETEPKYVALTVVNDAVADGDRDIVLAVTDLANATAGENPRLAVSVKEDDRDTVGSLSIVMTEPALAKSDTFLGRYGDTVTIWVDRTGGAKGCVTADVTTVAGAWIGTNRLVWAHHSRETRQSVTLKLPAADEYDKTSFKVTLVPFKGISASRKTLTVQLIADDLGFETSEVLEPALRRYVAYSNAVAVVNDRGGKLSVAKLSGSLPSGLSAKLVGKRLVVSGVPSAAKSCEAVYQVKEARPKETGRGTVTIPGMTVRFVFTVSDVTKPVGGEDPLNPAVAKSRTFSGLPVIDAANRRLAGVVDGLTVPPTGRASAKYRSQAGDVSLSAKSWSACAADGTLTAVLTAGRKPHVLTITVRADGSVGYELAGDPEMASAKHAGEVSVPAWSKTDTAEAWQGYYTVALPIREDETAVAYDGVPAALGNVWMTLKMNTSSAWKSGTVKYSGYLPTGKSFSGSGVLVRGADGVTATLPFVCRNGSSDYLTGAAAIVAGAKEAYESADNHRAISAPADVLPCYIHTETKAADGCYRVRYDLYGAYYDAKEDIEACAREKDRFRGVTLRFQADLQGRDALTKAESVQVDVSDAKIFLVAGQENERKVSLSFNRSTGVVNGSFNVYLDGSERATKATYRGILMPGWGGCSNCDPGTVYLPLVTGAYWFADALEYRDASGKEKKLSLKSGGVFRIDEYKE